MPNDPPELKALVHPVKGHLPLDVKTVSKSLKNGVLTGGVLSFFPSEGKHWDGPSFFIKPPIEIPADVREFLLARLGGSASASSAKILTTVSAAPRREKVLAAGTNDSSNLSSSGSSSYYNMSQPQAPFDEVALLTRRLAQWRVESYESWLHVGFCLANIGGGSHEFLELWIEFSKRSKLFKEGVCESKWRTGIEPREEGGYDIVGLRRWAAEDASDDGTLSLPAEHELIEAMSRLDARFADVRLEATGDGLSYVVSGPERMKGVVRRADMTVLADDGSYVGSLCPEFQMNKTLGFLHPSIPPRADTYTCNVVSDKETLLTSDMKLGADDATRVSLFNAWSSDNDSFAKVTVPGRNGIHIDNKSKLSKLAAIVTAAQDFAMATKFSEAARGLFNVVLVNNVNMNDDSASRTRDTEFWAPLSDAGIMSKIVWTGDGDKVFVHDSKTGLWRPGGLNDAAFVIRQAASPTLRSQLDATSLRLSEEDVTYLCSCNGPVMVVKALLPMLRNPDFKKRLNKVPDNCIPFDNGMLSIASRRLAPYVLEDYISETIGYDYSDCSDPANSSFMESFYESVLPDRAERLYFQRMIAKALFSSQPGKHFLILTDDRDGSNGKSTLMRGVELVAGRFKANTERDFLYQSTSSTNTGSNPNLMEYFGKKLAFFDEPSANNYAKRLDLERIKDLTSGVALVSARANYSNTMDSERFSALIVIACNHGNFPSIKGADMALMKRLKAIKMRSLFVPANELATHVAQGDTNVYAMDESTNFLDLFESMRLEHIKLLMDVYVDMDSGCIGPEPPCVQQMVDQLMEEADPRFVTVNEFLAACINFEPRRTAEFANKQYYAWIPEKQLYHAFWTWLAASASEKNSENDDDIIKKEDNTKSAWKVVIKRAMSRRKRECKLITPSGHKTAFKSYDRVQFTDSYVQSFEWPGV